MFFGAKLYIFCRLQGDAVFWYNLKRNGDGDTNTLHAACPVLVGQKWGNEFLHDRRLYSLHTTLDRRSMTVK